MMAQKHYSDSLGIEPEILVSPTSIDEVADAVARADASRQAVIPWGGGTAQAFGYTPRRADVLLDLSGLNQIVAHEPGDLTVTVEAGATLLTVQETLARHNQFLPLDPPSAGTATIGGILATNAWGPSRAHYGTARDWLIGLTVVDAQGRRVKGGGKVVKNVTGYDLPKLHVGALGTLGVIVEATFKVAPRPDASRALLFQLPTDEDAAVQGEIAAFLQRVIGETDPALGMVRDQAGARIATFIYSGDADVVEYQRDRAAQWAAHLGGVVGLRSVPEGMERPFTGIHVPEEALVVLIAGLPAGEYARHGALIDLAGSGARVDTYPGTGQTEIVLNGEADMPDALRNLLAWSTDTRAHFAALQAPLELRRADTHIPLWSPLPPAFPLMQRLKKTLDPNDTLNPGRFVGGL